MSEKYFAAKDSKDLAGILCDKVNEWNLTIDGNGLIEKYRACYAAQHGMFYTEDGEGHKVTFGGEQGELVNLPVNHWRNIASHMLVMTTSNRPAIDCRPTNTDYKSLVQTYLANNIIDYYMREKKLEDYFKLATEYAITYGSGYVYMGWDATKGEVVEHIEELNTDIHEGDLFFKNLSMLDVVFDWSRDYWDLDWIVVRTWKNKYDLAAKYPEFRDQILSLETKSDYHKYSIGLNNILEDTDDVEVKEFYHKRTESMPDGRYQLFLSRDLVLQDTAMPYRMLPVFRITPSTIHGTPHGYTPMFDLLPLQETLNSLYSVVATNQNAFGVQNVLIPRGADIQVNQLVGGLNAIEYNFQAGAEPKPLNLTATPAEIFKMIDMIKSDMETLSGINSVVRGNPEASLKSGTSLALVQSQALQFMSGLQQSYIQLIENVGTAIIKMLQDFAHTPRIVAIVGIANRSQVQEFNSEDISNISRVVADVGNPMARTVAGRTQMAQELIHYGEISAKQYINLIHTGSLDALTEAVVHESQLMRAENEALIRGEQPVATYAEDHKAHINSHRSILFDVKLKQDPDLVQRVHEHMQEHVQLLRTVDPDLLMLMNQQPLQPPAAPQPVPPMPEAPQDTSEILQAPDNTQAGMEGGRLSGPGLEQAIRIPSPAKVNASALNNPGIQQDQLGNVNFSR